MPRKKRWFYVDITTVCHERIAVKTVNERSAREIAEALVDIGEVDFTESGAALYGSENDSIVVAEAEPREPPPAMKRFDGAERVG